MTDLHLLTIEELKEELKKQQEISDDNYWKFCRCAASKCDTYVKNISEADTKIRIIKAEIRRRKGIIK